MAARVFSAAQMNVGDTGYGVQQWLSNILDAEFEFPHLRVIFPTAIPRPYTPNGGALSTVWYDRNQISPFAPDDESVDVTTRELAPLIEQELQLGIPINRIFFGGFSMGGGLAFQLGYRFYRQAAGVFALASFLSKGSKVYQALESCTERIPPLFQSHGELDDLVPYDWGKKTFETLQKFGVQGEFHSIPRLHHQLSPESVRKLQEWIMKLVPTDAPKL